jgi:hypothetical protein
MKSFRFRALALAALLTALLACSNDSPVLLESPTPTGTSGPATPTPDPSTSPIPAESANAGLLDLADGRHAAYVTELKLPDRIVTIDVIQILAGQEAADAFKRDNPGEGEGPPNDYYIVNANKKLRSGTITPEAGVKLVKLAQDSNADLNDATLDELDAYLKTVDRLMVPFWFTVAGGRITAIEEQYLP